MRDGALQKRASEIGQKETLALRLHELDQQIKDQVSQLKSSIESFSEEAFTPFNMTCYPKWSSLQA